MQVKMAIFVLFFVYFSGKRDSIYIFGSSKIF